jgi:hypothetical protein
MSSLHLNKRYLPNREGDLTQKNNSFQGNDYELCSQSEVLWAERCIKEDKYIPFIEEDYPQELNILIF